MRCHDSVERRLRAEGPTDLAERVITDGVDRDAVDRDGQLARLIVEQRHALLQLHAVLGF